MEIRAILIWRVIFDQPWKSTVVCHWIRLQSFKQLFFVLIVFIKAESMSCIHIKAVNAGCEWKFSMYFHIRWNELVTFKGQLKWLYK